jgi:hypothetical protein
MFFLKRLYVQFDHHVKDNLPHISINEGTRAFEPCIYVRKEHQWCSHEVIMRISLCSTKHHRYWSVAALVQTTQKFKTCIHSLLYPSQMRVHYWYGSPAKTTALFYWWSYFNDRRWSAVSEKTSIYCFHKVGHSVYSHCLSVMGSNMKYFLHIICLSVCPGFFLTKDQITYCANFTFSSNQIAWLLSID